jgi:hypothetical protein
MIYSTLMNKETDGRSSISDEGTDFSPHHQLQTGSEAHHPPIYRVPPMM